VSIFEQELPEALPFPDYVIPTDHIDIPIGTFHQEEQMYNNYPACQREKIWPISLKWSLIDTILRKFPIPELLAYQKGQYIEIIDGRQRLSTILDYMHDVFPTARIGTRLKEDPCLEPVEPNKRYSALSPQARHNFDRYTLRISIVKNLDECQLGALFRRLQNQQSLTQAEKLWTFTSTARMQAAELANHRFWTTLYTGRHARRFPFLGCLMLLGLELTSGITNLTTPYLRSLAAGAADQQITSAVTAKIQQRLEDATHLFDGTSIHSLKEIIPVYQSLILLEKADCDVAKSTRGCLSPWFAQVREASLQARKTDRSTDLLSKLQSSSSQLLFWEVELPKVRLAPGICIIDRKRTFSKTDREQAWHRQGGICPGCGQPITLSDIGHHVLAHAKGGPTTAENCILFHEVCHNRFHALPGVQWEVLQDGTTSMEQETSEPSRMLAHQIA
jgi:hypothetical protein